MFDEKGLEPSEIAVLETVKRWATEGNLILGLVFGLDVLSQFKDAPAEVIEKAKDFRDYLNGAMKRGSPLWQSIVEAMRT